MENTKKLEIVYLDPQTLVPNKLNNRMFGDPFENESYQELLESIKRIGIRDPLIILPDRNVRSGNVRLDIARRLNMKLVPCIIENKVEMPDIKRSEENEQIIDDYVTISHDTHKIETPYSKLERIKVFERFHGLRQGIRSDIDSNLEKVKKDRDQIAPQTERNRLKAIDKNLQQMYPDDATKRVEYWSKVGKQKSIAAAAKETKILAIKSKETTSLNNRFDYITESVKIYNQSCLDLSFIPDASIRAVICSPPYFLMKPSQEGFDNEIGQDDTNKEYAQNLVEHFIPCKQKLLKDGSIWVVINDGVKNGSYTGAVHYFITAMLENGLLLNDVLIWAKTSSQPSGGDRSCRNFEYVLQFCLNAIPKCDYTWLDGMPEFSESKFGTGTGIKLTSYVNLNQGFIKTNMANTEKLRMACEKENFYLEHSSTYPPEIPFACIKISCKNGDHIVDLFNGCGNTAKAALYADMNLTYHGFEINPLSCRASKINIEMDFKKKENAKSIPLNVNNDTQQVA